MRRKKPYTTLLANTVYSPIPNPNTPKTPQIGSYSTPSSVNFHPLTKSTPDFSSVIIADSALNGVYYQPNRYSVDPDNCDIDGNGQSSGCFGARVTIDNLCDGAYYTIGGYIDSDSCMDVAAICRDSQTVVWYKSGCDDSAQQVTGFWDKYIVETHANLLKECFSVKLVDMNLDGHIDMVVGCENKNSYGISVYFGAVDESTAAGYTFTRTAYWLASSHEVSTPAFHNSPLPSSSLTLLSHHYHAETLRHGRGRFRRRQLPRCRFRVIHKRHLVFYQGQRPVGLPRHYKPPSNPYRAIESLQYQNV